MIITKERFAYMLTYSCGVFLLWGFATLLNSLTVRIQELMSGFPL